MSVGRRVCSFLSVVGKYRLATLVTGSLVLAGCSTVPPIEPDELTTIESTRTATINWSTDVGDGGDRAAVRFAPFVTEEQVFAIDSGGTVTALERASGNELWSVELDNDLTAGISGDDEFLFVATANGDVYSLQQLDGSTRWKAEVSSEVIAAPVAGPDYIVVRSIDGKVYALEKESGSRRWVYSYTVPALSLHGNARPLVVADGVLVGLDNGELVALRGTDGRVFWSNVLSDSSGRSEVEQLNDLDADPLVVGPYIYAVNYQGVVARIDPDRGQSLWTTEVSSSAGLSAIEDLVVVTDEFDTVWGLNAEDGSVLWKQESFSYRRLTAPAITADGVVVVGDYQGYLHLLSSSDGSIVGRKKVTSKEITNRPILRDGVVYVQGRSGDVSAVTL